MTLGNNSDGPVTGFTAGSGYDMASGLGTPSGAVLVPALCGASPGTTVVESTPPTTTTTATPPAISPPAISPPPTTTSTTTTTTVTTTTPVTSRPAPAAVQFVASPRRAGRIGASLSQPLHAYDRLRLGLAYAASGLPNGLRINRVSGTVSGLPRRTGSSIVATDTAGNAQSVVIRWTIAGRASRARRQAHHARAHRRPQTARSHHEAHRRR